MDEEREGCGTISEGISSLLIQQFVNDANELSSCFALSLALQSVELASRIS